MSLLSLGYYDARFYNEQGYLHLKRFFDEAFIGQLNQIVDTLETELSPGDEAFDESGTGKIKQIQYLHKKHEVFDTLTKTLEPLAKKLTGSQELNVLNVQLFEKHPEISKPTRAHQDNAYFKVSPAKALTFWIPLDDIDEENGTIYYAPKTHLTPTRKHQRYHKSTTFRTRSGVPGLSLCLKEHPEELDKVMHARVGDLFVHHCNTIHRAGKNLSENRRRRAVGVVFIPKECETDPRLFMYHTTQLKEDIELQKVKDPVLYKKLREKFDYLF